MEGERLYPNIAYFKLAKEMPSAKVGTEVIISDADGNENLIIHEMSEDGLCAFGEGIKLDIGFAKRYPEWFTAITKEEHIKNCKNNTIEWFMKKGKTREKAEQLYEQM